MKLEYDKLLSDFAFNCNLRHYTPAGVHAAPRLVARSAMLLTDVVVTQVGAVQLDPGFWQLTLCLLSTLETKT